MKRPIRTKGDVLIIEPDKMEVDKYYNFHYLGVKMAAIKSPDGAVDIFQRFKQDFPS